MSLTALPPEIFCYIVASIESQLALANLAQCSRKFYLWTIPHLYHHVQIHEENEKGNGKLRNLASSLFRRPDLAGLVRHFALQVASSEAPRDFEYLEKSKESEEHGSYEVDQAIKTAVDASGVSKEEKKSWLIQLSQPHTYHFDLILSLLLPALLNVEELVLALDIKSQLPYLERMLRSAAKRERPFDIQSPFEALKVFVCSHKMRLANSRGSLALLLKLPAIQVVSVRFWNKCSRGKSENRPLMELDSSSSPLTSLYLGADKLSRADLGHILRVPKDLKTFYYTASPFVRTKFTDIRHALGLHDNCLERLGFGFDKYWDASPHSMRKNNYWGPMTSFTSFNTLKIFKTAAVFLGKTDNGTDRRCLINIFPLSLETLHLTCLQDLSGKILEAIEHLLSQKSSEQIPWLKKVIFEENQSIGHASLMDELWRGTQETAIGRLSRVAAAQGVSIDVTDEVSPCRSYHDTIACPGSIIVDHGLA